MQNSIRIGLGDGVARTPEACVPLSARELLLCATIGLNGRPMATEAILETLWPDSDLDRARSCLKVFVHRIRARLGSRTALVRAAERWALGPGVTLDLCEWERLARDCGPIPMMDSQRTALSRIFESLLAGPVPSLARSHLGRRLEVAFLDLLHQVGAALIEDAFARGDATQSARLARSAVALDPYGERWHEALIRAHMLSGNVFAARTTLRSYQATLQAELGESVPKALAEMLTNFSPQL